MTNEEQIKAYRTLRANGKAFFIDNYEDADRIIEALEKQRYISAKIEWLKTLNPYEMILVSDVLDWFEDSKVEE